MRDYSIIITKVPGGSKPVITNGEKTIAVLFAEAFNGEKLTGYQIQVNGEDVESDYVPERDDNITVAKQVKGNK